MAKSPVYTTSKTQRQKNVKQRDCQVSGCPLFIRLYCELSAAALKARLGKELALWYELLPSDYSYGRQLLTDKCQKWLQNRSDLEKEGDPRLLTGGPPSFYAQQALKSKSEGIKGKSRGSLLTTATTGKPCFVCGFLARWWRRPSPLGGPGGWLYSICHPNPEKKTVNGVGTKHQLPDARTSTSQRRLFLK
ncbi:hypothetical protein ES703_53981 [subsurface metagenome]